MQEANSQAVKMYEMQQKKICSSILAIACVCLILGACKRYLETPEDVIVEYYRGMSMRDVERLRRSCTNEYFQRELTIFDMIWVVERRIGQDRPQELRDEDEIRDSMTVEVEGDVARVEVESRGDSWVLVYRNGKWLISERNY